MKILLMIFFTWQNIIVYPCEGKKVRIKCNEDDTIGDLKKLVAAQCGTRSASSCSLSLWLSSCHSLISISLLSTLFLSRCFSHIYLSCILSLSLSLSLSLILSFSLCISLSRSLSVCLSLSIWRIYRAFFVFRWDKIILKKWYTIFKDHIRNSQISWFIITTGYSFSIVF